MGNYIFLDTQVFESYNFSVENKYFQKLIEHIRLGNITLVTSAIITQEIKKHIKSRVKKLINVIRENKIVYTIPGADKVEFLSKDNSVLATEIWNEINKKIYCFGKDVELSNSNPEEVFNDYFASIPPFQDGKKEFPDAFVANSLLNWAKKNDYSIAIVSGNTKDWEKICECEKCNSVFTFYKTLPAFLDSLTSIITKEREQIKECVQNSFANEFLSHFRGLPVTIDPEKLSWDDFSDPDVDYDSLNFPRMDINIVEYDHESNVAEVSVDGVFCFNSHIDIDDIESAIYDSEERETIGYWDRLRGTVKAEREFSCMVTVYKDDDKYKIDSLEIDSPRNIELSWGYCHEYCKNDSFIPDPFSKNDDE